MSQFKPIPSLGLRESKTWLEPYSYWPDRPRKKQLLEEDREAVLRSSPESLLADALKKVEALKIKVAQSSLATDPRMLAITGEEKELKKELLKIQRWLNPETGLESRIVKLTKQIREAEENLENANSRETEIHDRLVELDEKRKQTASQISTEEILKANG